MLFLRSRLAAGICQGSVAGEDGGLSNALFHDCPILPLLPEHQPKLLCEKHVHMVLLVPGSCISGVSQQSHPKFL